MSHGERVVRQGFKPPARGEVRKTHENENRAAQVGAGRRPWNESVMLHYSRTSHNFTGRTDSAAQIYHANAAAGGMHHE